MESTVRNFAVRPVTQRLSYSRPSSSILNASTPKRMFSTSAVGNTQSQFWNRRIPQNITRPVAPGISYTGMPQNRTATPIGYVSPAQQNVSAGPDWLSQLLAGYRIQFE